MKIVCVGAGPAGLYFAILSKLRDPGVDVRVVERNPRGVTNGWGVVFWDDLLAALARTDPESARRIRATANQWHDQQVHVGAAKPARMGGYGFSIGRARLLEILTSRAESLGVRVDFDTRSEDPVADFPDADLVVAADGANSRIRARYAEELEPTIEEGRNRYIWLGTHKTFDVFTFAFERTSAGWLWFHGYRFNSDTSTCIVECPPGTWDGLGLGELDLDGSVALLQDVFAGELDGHELINQSGLAGVSPWLRFADVTNQHWSHGNVVLVGDAAHTTHFSIGSGTKLAIEDAIGLDRAMRAHAGVAEALAAYQRDRAAAVALRQRAARRSTAWFESVPERIEIDDDPVRFAYALRTRRDLSAPGGVSWMLHQATQYPLGQRARRLVSSTKRRLRGASKPRG
ncbi:MAG: anthraniloyl-CoA monooxygenase [Micromonosporaceae bacterium]|nr:anthraniloyl-CoA monooxygenase [Micromonosporaceae bacterium]